MRYNLDFNYCAIAIYVLVLLVYLNKKKAPYLHNRIFTVLVSAGLIGAVISTVAIITNEHPENYSTLVHVIMNYAAFLLVNASPFLFAVYVVAMTRNHIWNHDIRLDLLLYLPFSIDIMMFLLNPWTKAIFYYGEDGIFSRGNLQFVLYAVAFYYGAFGAIYTWKCLSKYAKDLNISLYLFCAAGFISAGIQFMFPQLQVQYLGIAICELLLMFTVQKPEEYLDSITGIFNQRTFNQLVIMKADSTKPRKFLVVYLEENSVLSQTVGIDGVTELTRLVARYLEDLNPNHTYYLNSYTYVLILPNSINVRFLTQKIEQRFSKEWDLNGNFLHTTVKQLSIDVPNDINNLDTFYEAIEILKRVKTKYDGPLTVDHIDLKRAHRRVQVESAIKKAMIEDRFEMYYQPIYSVSKDRIISAEALIRLKDPELGFIPPDEFIPIAEKNGSILKLGEIIFRKVFTFLAKNDIKALGIEQIEVNLSMIQCMQENLAKQIKELMDEYKVNPQFINLEITETAASYSPRVLLQNMEELHQYGIHFAMDDYGTGYSNLQNILALPLKLVKFDKTLLDGREQHENGEVMYECSTEMMKKIGMQIVAEGVETREQKELLSQLGIDYLQGFYFSKPLPEKEFLEFCHK